jgi:hypothetical protein
LTEVEGLTSLVTKYRRQGILVDTNLLLLFCVGVHDPDQIEKFKRTRTFIKDDFELLVHFLAAFDKVITIPNILTEVNSLSNQLNEQLKPAYYQDFANHIQLMEESYIPSSEISRTEPFGKFGLTDSGIVELVRTRYLVLSDDLRLVGHLQKVGIDSINFNHLRYEAWQ